MASQKKEPESKSGWSNLVNSRPKKIIVSLIGIVLVLNILWTLKQNDTSSETPVLKEKLAKVLVTYRDHPRGSFVGVYNVTPQWRSVAADQLARLGVMGATDVLTDTIPFGSTSLEGAGDGRVPVPPYVAWWLVRPTD